MQKEFLENVEELLEKDRGKLELEANSNTNISVSLEDVSNEEAKTNNSDDVESLKIIDEESFVKKSDSNSGNMKIFDYVEGYFNNSDDIKEVENFINEDNEDYPNSHIDEIKQPNNASVGEVPIDDLKKHDMKPFVNLGNGEINLSDLEELSDEDKITMLESMQRERKEETEIEIVNNEPQSGQKTDDDHR